MWATPTAPLTFSRFLLISETPIGLPLDAASPRPQSADFSRFRVCGSPHCTTNPGIARWNRWPS